MFPLPLTPVISANGDRPWKALCQTEKLAMPLIQQVVSIGRNNNRLNSILGKKPLTDAQCRSRLSGAGCHFKDAALGLQERCNSFILMSPSPRLLRRDLSGRLTRIREILRTILQQALPGRFRKIEHFEPRSLIRPQTLK